MPAEAVDLGHRHARSRRRRRRTGTARRRRRPRRRGRSWCQCRRRWPPADRGAPARPRCRSLHSWSRGGPRVPAEGTRLAAGPGPPGCRQPGRQGERPRRTAALRRRTARRTGSSWRRSGARARPRRRPAVGGDLDHRWPAGRWGAGPGAPPGRRPRARRPGRSCCGATGRARRRGCASWPGPGSAAARPAAGRAGSGRRPPGRRPSGGTRGRRRRCPRPAAAAGRGRSAIAVSPTLRPGRTARMPVPAYRQVRVVIVTL